MQLLSMLSVLAATIGCAVQLPYSKLVAATISKPTETVQIFEKLSPGFKFRDVIASWNVERAEGTIATIEARAHGEGYETKWYTLGKWSLGSERQSLKHQSDERGTVNTDTLSLKQDATNVDLRITFSGGAPKLKLLTACFTAHEGGIASERKQSQAWGKCIDVPTRAQGNYPNGGVLCSATSTSMLLAHYASRLDRPELDHDVPDVQSCVWDQVYNGAGNWPFNTAYFGSFPGLRGYVSRFSSIADLEMWIEAGYPVVCSVSFDMLRGKPLSPTESGHLVVLVGFTADGEPVFNDPAKKDQVRFVYNRDDFEKAWLYSSRTVYIMVPETATPPISHGCWLSQ